MRVMRPSATVATMQAGMATVGAVGRDAVQHVLLEEAAGDDVAAHDLVAAVGELASRATRAPATTGRGPGRGRRSWSTPRCRGRSRRPPRRGRRPRWRVNMRSASARVSSSVMASSWQRQDLMRIVRRSIEPTGKGRPNHGTDRLRGARRGAGGGRPGPGHQRLAGDHPGAGRPVRRRHRRPPVDPRRSRAGRGRSLRWPHRPRLPDAVAVQRPAPRDRRGPGACRWASTTGPTRCASRRPSRSGSRIRAQATLAAVDEVAGGIQTTMVITIEVEGGTKPACVIESISRYLA